MADKGERTREKILTEALQLFRRKGFGATTINDLLKAAEVTKGNLYFHFSDKEAIGLAVLRGEQQSFNCFLDSALEGASAAEGLNNFFRAVLEQHRLRGFVGGCLFGNTALEASDTEPIFAALIQEVFRDWIGKIEDKISVAQAAAEVRTDVAAAVLAELVVATIEGSIMQARLHKSERPLRRSLDALKTMLELNVQNCDPAHGQIFSQKAAL